jgi:hypothetical protein
MSDTDFTTDDLACAGLMRADRCDLFREFAGETFATALERAVGRPKTKRAAVRRKPSIATMIKRAEKSGREVTSVTLPDGTRLNFGESAPSETKNPWLDDLKVKQ